jgi:hypothetical protein
VTFAGAYDGGLHLIAWRSEFPSQTEAIIWRTASITIFTTEPLCVLVITWCIVTTSQRVVDELGEDCKAIPRVPVFLRMLWYIVRRVFIIVECFILLAHIPETIRHVPTCAAYIQALAEGVEARSTSVVRQRIALLDKSCRRNAQSGTGGISISK